MRRQEWVGQVLFDGEHWRNSGRFDHKPTADELRGKAWSSIAMRVRGTPYPVAVRSVTVTYEPSPPHPFRESAVQGEEPK